MYGLFYFPNLVSGTGSRIDSAFSWLDHIRRNQSKPDTMTTQGESYLLLSVRLWLSAQELVIYPSCIYYYSD